MHRGRVETCELNIFSYMHRLEGKKTEKIFHFPVSFFLFSVTHSQLQLGKRYRGVYKGQDVAIKVLRSEHLNATLEDEFAQEVAILRYMIVIDASL